MNANHWLEELKANNPDAERVELNPSCKYHCYQRFLNNSFNTERPKFNPIDWDHPGAFDAAMRQGEMQIGFKH